MLDFPRWKTFAILLTTAIVCLVAVPNFLSAKTVESWPKWAQHRIALSYDLSGGSRYVLAVDVAMVRRQVTEELRDEVRRTLREGRIGLLSAPAVRGESVEVRIRGEAFEDGLVRLRAFSGEATVEFDGTLIRLTPSEALISDRIASARRGATDQIRRVLTDVGVPVSIELQGVDRFAMEFGLVDHRRMLSHYFHY